MTDDLGNNKEADEPARTFDGGFFMVKSPMCDRKSPRSFSKSSSNKLRQGAYSNSAKNVNSFLLSPLISAMAKMSVRSSGNDSCVLSFNLNSKPCCYYCSGSPMSSDVSNNISPVKVPRPTILFDDNEEEDHEHLSIIVTPSAC